MTAEGAASGRLSDETEAQIRRWAGAHSRHQDVSIFTTALLAEIDALREERTNLHETLQTIQGTEAYDHGYDMGQRSRSQAVKGIRAEARQEGWQARNREVMEKLQARIDHLKQCIRDASPVDSVGRSRLLLMLDEVQTIWEWMALDEEAARGG